MKVTKHIAVIIWFLILASHSSAKRSPFMPAPPDTGIVGIGKAIEIYKVQDAFRRQEMTAFTMFYASARTDTPFFIRDTMSVFYKVHLGMMKGTTATSEMLFNDRYSMMVSNDDSMISVGNSNAGSNNLQINILDSLFQAVNVDSITVTTSVDTSILTIGFKPGSFYKDYKLYYNKNTYRIYRIRMVVEDTEYADQGRTYSASVNRIMEIFYLNYTTGGFGIGIFDERQFIKKNQYGAWVGQENYAQYQIIDSEEDAGGN